MRTIKIFLIMLICMISTTGLQANTPDLKKNSKAELVKQTEVSVQFVSVAEANDVFCVDFTQTISQSYSDVWMQLKKVEIYNKNIDVAITNKFNPFDISRERIQNTKLAYHNKFNKLLHRLSRWI